ncbi:Uncharacterized conserved protein [Evansella caseinilytica]|uniref:Uncharacterized conserved protein n=1 Tax=Evansella caseinilytica TaxID=1503961 RepID=A0A1H3PKX8_9BACI|nr:DUF2249 domain-containing protein [Evansella caseinilytica]SDZ01756.1 Uncharacterized conserved protein [Evansella caseinilytica]
MKAVILDVREDLKNHQDPFKKIMGTVKALKKEEALILHSTILPKPLLMVMKAKGYENKVEKISNDHYQTTFTRRKEGFFSSLFNKEQKEESQTLQQEDNILNTEEKTAYFLDNRGLQPPKPMIRTMKRLETMKQNETLTIHNDRVPVHLLEELKDMAIDYNVEQFPDGSAKISLTKK